MQQGSALSVVTDCGSRLRALLHVRFESHWCESYVSLHIRMLLLSSMLLPSRCGCRIVTDSRISPNRDTVTHRSVAALSVGHCVDGVVFRDDAWSLSRRRDGQSPGHQLASRVNGAVTPPPSPPQICGSRRHAVRTLSDPKQLDRQRLVHFVAV